MLAALLSIYSVLYLLKVLVYSCILFCSPTFQQFVINLEYRISKGSLLLFKNNAVHNCTIIWAISQGK